MTAVEQALRALIDAALDYRWNDQGRARILRAAHDRLASAWSDFVAASTSPRQLQFERESLAEVVARVADGLFYDRGAADEAIATFELALEVDPRCLTGLRGIVAAYLQGSERRPRQALPYVERLALLDPARRKDVEYVRSLLRE